MSAPAEHAATEGREGMLTVYDHEGGYVGCMGVQTWEWLRESGMDAPALVALAARADELERDLAYTSERVRQLEERAERAKAALRPFARLDLGALQHTDNAAYRLIRQEDVAAFQRYIEAARDALGEQPQ